MGRRCGIFRRHKEPDQLGLELVPSREPIEMLVVEKVK
jgi:hypothetical protein